MGELAAGRQLASAKLELTLQVRFVSEDGEDGSSEEARCAYGRGRASERQGRERTSAWAHVVGLPLDNEHQDFPVMMTFIGGYVYSDDMCLLRVDGLWARCPLGGCRLA